MGIHVTYARLTRLIGIASGVADKIAKVLVVLLMAVLVGIISLEVIFRYVLTIPLVWAEQLASYAMIWLAFMSAAIAFRQGAHIGMTLLSSKVTGRIRKLISALSHLLILFFLASLAWWGVVHVLDVMAQKSPVVFNISMMWPYLALPTGAILMIIQEVNLVLAGRETIPDENISS